LAERRKKVRTGVLRLAAEDVMQVEEDVGDAI
jgi:hypothetical protein